MEYQVGLDYSVMSLSITSIIFTILTLALVTIYLNKTLILYRSNQKPPGQSSHTSGEKGGDIGEMSKSSASSKGREAQFITEFRSITGASQKDATAFIKKYKTSEAALDAFFNDSAAQANTAGSKGQEKKLGEIWERFKDASDPKLIKIEGTMEMCEELGIDPESDSVLFCLSADLGSKVTGEFEKNQFVQGWMSMPGNIDSMESMKSRLPALRKNLNVDPSYFKKVYLHTFDLIKQPGSRVLQLDTAVDMWTLFILPALKSTPSALSHESSSTPTFTEKHFEQWLEFQKKKGKAISKDTWTLLIDFIRSIDSEFKEYDESGAWPSTIDDFVEYVRGQKA